MFAALVVSLIAVVILAVFGMCMAIERSLYKKEAERCLNNWHQATTESSATYRKLTVAEARLKGVADAMTLDPYRPTVSTTYTTH